MEHKNIRLRVRTIERLPKDYATTQNNLGNAFARLAQLPNRDAEEYLDRALTAYHASLTIVRTDALSPMHAIVQRNIGLAFANLAQVRDKETNLNQAIAAFRKALGIYMFDVSPQNNASIQRTLADVFGELAQLKMSSGAAEEAKDMMRAMKNCVLEALRFYTEASSPAIYLKLRSTLQSLDAQLSQ